MKQKNRKAFTMIELVFVIVVIGILAAVAIPRLAATRDDAILAKARTTIASVRSALAMERQKRILRGDFNTTLTSPSATDIFTVKMGGTETKLLEYDVKHCHGSRKRNCWERGSTIGEFKFYDTHGDSCLFIVNKGHFSKSTCSVSGFSDL